jgi:hypothetical protein
VPTTLASTIPASRSVEPSPPATIRCAATTAGSRTSSVASTAARYLAPRMAGRGSGLSRMLVAVPSRSSAPNAEVEKTRLTTGSSTGRTNWR